MYINSGLKERLLNTPIRVSEAVYHYELSNPGHIDVEEGETLAVLNTEADVDEFLSAYDGCEIEEWDDDNLILLNLLDTF